MAVSQIYWLADDPEVIISKLAGHHGRGSVWGDHPVCQAWMRNQVAYYSPLLEANDWMTSLGFGGVQGEYVKMVIPQARTLVRQTVGIVTKSKLSFTSIAESRGTDVLRESRIGTALANQIVKDQKLGKKRIRMAERACVLGQAYLKASWRTDLGQPGMRGDQGIIYDGDLEISSPSIYDVLYDFSVPDFEDLDWVEVRTRKNRWSLIAQHPEIEDEIMGLPRVMSSDDPNSFGSGRPLSDDDTVYVYELYHRTTAALPKGRMLVYGDSKTVFYDDANPYVDPDGNGFIPVVCCRPEDIEDMGFGYPMLSSLLPAQEMLDHGVSAIATNQASSAVQNFCAPKTANVSVEDIGGMNFFQYNPVPGVPGGGKPEAINLTASAPETFKFNEFLLGQMEQLSNLNAALRGNPPAGVTSGVAIATLSTSALEFVTPLAEEVSRAIEQIVTFGIWIYKKFATKPHKIHMLGKNSRTFSQNFDKSDLEPLKRVQLTESSPVLQTIAGRADIAEKLVGSGLVKSVQEYISILEGAPMQQLYETELSENDLIQSENEAMLEGRPVVALATDGHAAHMRKHAALLNDPEMRLNNTNVQGVLNHVLEHYNLLQTTDPNLQAIMQTGKMPEGGMMMQQPQQLPQGQPPGGAPPPDAPAEPTATTAQPADDLLGRM